MPVALRKDSIDLGVVIKDSAASLAFYRDLLGFEHVADTPVPGSPGATMHRLLCGSSMIKLLHFAEEPGQSAPRGGIGGATGYRYFTMQVTNLDEITQGCKDAGARVVVDGAEVRPGLRISIVGDPDGNLVEFVDDTTQ